MSADALVTTLKSMKLHGMAGAVAELAEQGAPAFKQSNDLRFFVFSSFVLVEFFSR
jgi:hypothetical protein